MTTFRSSFWRSFVWVSCTMISAYLLGVDYNWRVVTLCCLTVLFDNLIWSAVPATKPAIKSPR
jgi:hypothetical protein